MMSGGAAGYGEKCPNRETRSADTATYYDEVTAFTYGSGGGFRRRYRSYSKSSTYGNVWLCEQCSAAYERSVKLRRRGTKVANIGFVALLISIVLFLILYNHAPSLHTGTLVLIPTAPLLFSLLAMLLGSVVALFGRAQPALERSGGLGG